MDTEALLSVVQASVLIIVFGPVILFVLGGLFYRPSLQQSEQKEDMSVFTVEELGRMVTDEEHVSQRSTLAILELIKRRNRIIADIKEMSR